MTENNYVFVYRDLGDLLVIDPQAKQCPWCSTPLDFVNFGEWIYMYHEHHCYVKCSLCGWQLEGVWETEEHLSIYPEHVRVLRAFDVNSTQLAIDELGTHLRSNYADMYSLSWRRFEEVVEDVFKSRGLSTVLTQPSKDGGADILIIEEDGSGTQAIIECKKYSAEKKIGVALVRTLVGAAVDWKVSKAYLVTSSTGFTRGARLKAKEFKSRGFEIDLVAASELLSYLKVYNAEMPPLHRLTEEVRREIINQNLQGSRPQK